MTKIQNGRLQRGDRTTAFLMLLPAFVILTIFGVIPLLMATVQSFQDYHTHAFTLANYDYVFKTPEFLKSFKNVIQFTAIITVLLMVLPFLFAHVIRGMAQKASRIVKVVIYLPCMISAVATSIIYAFILNYGGGLLTSIFYSLGMEPISFLTEGIWPQVVIIIITVWCNFGYYSLIMLAGLLNIPKSYFEAARLDGAGSISMMTHVTIPCMKNYFILMLINLITGNLQMMDIPYLVTGGGPLNRTLTPALYLYNSFRDTSRNQNVTIAGALLIMLMIVTINAVVFRLIHSEKSGE